MRPIAPNKITNISGVATLVIGLVVSVLIAYLVSWAEARQESVRFDAQVDQVQSRVRGRIERFENFLIQARGHLLNSGEVTRDRFQKYVTDIQLKEGNPALQGLAYISRVQSRDLPKHVRALRAEGAEDYELHPARARDEYYPISYIEPLDWRNKRAVGFDMFSEPVRREAMERARDTGRPALSGKVILVQETNREVQSGFLMFLPVYRDGAKTETVEQRRAALIGFLGCPFRAGDFFKIIFTDQDPLVDFEVFDGTEISTAALMYDFDGRAQGRHREIRKLDLAGHSLTIGFDTLESERNFRVLPFIVGLCGIVISLLLWWIVRSAGARAEDSRKSEQALQQSERRLRQSVVGLERSQADVEFEKRKLEQIFENAPAAMALWVGEDLVFEKVNPRYQAYFPDIELVGKPFLEALPEFEGQPFAELILDVYRTGKPFVGHEALARHRRFKDGPVEDRYYDFTYLQIKGADGKPYGVYDHAVDVTDRVLSRKALEQASVELRLAKEEAERANQLKSAFLANMSHEIRTPLGAMIGFADLLRDQGLSENQRANYLDILARNGEQLSAIINDILDLSKVEAGHLTLEHLEISPNQIAVDVVALLRLKAQEKDLALEYVSEPTMPRTVVSDAVRVRQVMLNLVANAIKFTTYGAVKVRGYGRRSEQGVDCVCFEVEDTGIGIPENQRDKIFEVFVQADGSMTRRFGGTGLGLALSRKLARALGGEVTILRTMEGKGTTFLFTFEDQPARLNAKLAPHRDDEHKNIEFAENVLEGTRVLVVDDAQDNQQLIRRYLTKRGAEVDSAENGFEGIRQALAGEFDVVLMDIQMPVMDGYTATAKLRAAGFKKPIIALTAHAMSEVRRKSMNVGCTDHLTKPINPKELVSAIVSAKATAEV